MAQNGLKPSPSRRNIKEKAEPEQFVTSEVEEQRFKEGVKTGARIAWITASLTAVILIIGFLTAAFIAIPEWRPYLPEFLNWLAKVIEGLFKAL
jgi:hypothetical protein